MTATAADVDRALIRSFTGLAKLCLAVVAYLTAGLMLVPSRGRAALVAATSLGLVVLLHLFTRFAARAPVRATGRSPADAWRIIDALRRGEPVGDPALADEAARTAERQLRWNQATRIVGPVLLVFTIYPVPAGPLTVHRVATYGLAVAFPGWITIDSYVRRSRLVRAASANRRLAQSGVP